MTGQSLRAWRQAHKLSQQKLSELLGVTLGIVNRWEMGRVRLTPERQLWIRVQLRRAGYSPPDDQESAPDLRNRANHSSTSSE